MAEEDDVVTELLVDDAEVDVDVIVDDEDAVVEMLVEEADVVVESWSGFSIQLCQVPSSESSACCWSRCDMLMKSGEGSILHTFICEVLVELGQLSVFVITLVGGAKLAW